MSEVDGRRRRGRGRLWPAIAAVAILILLAAVTPSPYAIERPGPVVDAFGSIEVGSETETPVIRIDGAETYPTSGELNVLSVSISGTPDRPVDWLSLVGTLFDPTRTIVPLDALFPEGLTSEQRTEQNASMMSASQLSATAAALKRLGEPVEPRLRVVGVDEAGPSAGVLREGDAIRRADDEPVTGLEELREVLGRAAPGRAVRLEIMRDDAIEQVDVEPETGADGTRLLGVTVTEDYSSPFDVELELDEIGGPSAGLVFALAIYDLLTPGELTGGAVVSGTGTIDADGAVGAIGGLTQKIWGASLAGTEVMLMPIENCADVPDRLPDGMRIVPVGTLDEAIAALETIEGGEDPAGLERCAADSATGSD